MRILWIKTELLHPVDKGGRIRTYHMLRSLSRRHDVTYVCLDDGLAAPDAIERALEYAQKIVVVPFLDHPLTEWVAALPQTMKLRGMTTKWILREAMQGRLPAPILERRKMGFPVPVGSWLRGPWRPLLSEYLSGSRARARGFFEASAVERLVGEHIRGVNHGERLWALLTFEIWARIFLDGETPWSLALPLRRAA